MEVYLEKLVFLEMTNRDMSLLPNQEFYDTYNLLNEAEKIRYYAIKNQVDNILRHIKTESILNAHTKIADSILEYNELVEKVDPLIIKCHKDFGVTLKGTNNEKFKEAIICILGRDFYEKHFK
jgi:hypothetical protein